MSSFAIVLVSAGVQLIFTVGSIRLCAEHSDDNIEIFLLLLGGACTEPRPFLLLKLPHWKGNLGCIGGWEETQPA